jgi:hypothetical protein
MRTGKKREGEKDRGSKEDEEKRGRRESNDDEKANKRLIRHEMHLGSDRE